MVIAFATALAASMAIQTTEVPLETFSAPNLFFVCHEAGLPSIGIDYDEMHREMDFGRFDQPITLFTLDDPIKSVAYEGDNSSGRWIIQAEGTARDVRGRIADGTPVRMRLVIHRTSGSVGTADFTVEAGSFNQESVGCRVAPTRPRPGHMQ